jgi:DNA-binding NarL/FixJ family response regulator
LPLSARSAGIQPRSCPLWTICAARAYEMVEGLDALLCRSWLRTLMRDRGLAVPGRRQTLAENERLLAADGLTNKQLATVLQASEKSVESRLSRLFTRSGYQSRVELATVVHTGEYPV